MDLNVIVSLLLLLLPCFSGGWPHVGEANVVTDGEPRGRMGTDNSDTSLRGDPWDASFQTRKPDESEGAKIVGGEDLVPNSWPFLVLIRKKQQPWCGGSILDPTHILSAAHCFKNQDPSLYQIIAGEHDTRVQSGKEQVMSLKNITRHPRYRDWRSPNDVAVLTLSSPLMLTKEVQTVELNTKSSCPQAKETCTVAGWGHTSYRGQGSPVAQKVDVPVQPDGMCSAIYRQYKADQLCAGDAGIDSCQGDSGGPFVCQCDGSLRQSGVVSYGYECATPGYPGVYARVSYFHSWIQDTLKQS